MTERSGPVAVFQQPLPLTALAAIGDLIARVYGEGETIFAADGLSLTIYPPDGGFLAKRTTPAEVIDDAEDIEARLTFVDGRVSIEFEDAQERVVLIAGVLMAWFEQLGAVNYVETTLSTAAGETFVLSLQRKNGKTPHELRLEAEAKLEEALRQ